MANRTRGHGLSADCQRRVRLNFPLNFKPESLMGNTSLHNLRYPVILRTTCFRLRLVPIYFSSVNYSLFHVALQLPSVYWSINHRGFKFVSRGVKPFHISFTVSARETPGDNNFSLCKLPLSFHIENHFQGLFK